MTPTRGPAAAASKSTAVVSGCQPLGGRVRGLPVRLSRISRTFPYLLTPPIWRCVLSTCRWNYSWLCKRRIACLLAIALGGMAPLVFTSTATANSCYVPTNRDCNSWQRVTINTIIHDPAAFNTTLGAFHYNQNQAVSARKCVQPWKYNNPSSSAGPLSGWKCGTQHNFYDLTTYTVASPGFTNYRCVQTQLAWIDAKCGTFH